MTTATLIEAAWAFVVGLMAGWVGFDIAREIRRGR
jgi:hypothetical protein